jgi:hypothetical protein
MADIKDPEEGQAVESVTELGDELNPTEVNRPPFSTNQTDVPIAHSSIGGPGAPTPPTEADLPLPEDQVPDGKGGVHARDEADEKPASSGKK